MRTASVCGWFVGSMAQTNTIIESDTSSPLSSPREHPPEGPRRVEEPSPHSPNGTYSHPPGQEGSQHQRQPPSSEVPSKYAQQRPYEYSPFRQPEPQQMANRALHVLGNADAGGAGYYHGATSGVEQNGHSWHSERRLPAHDAVNSALANLFSPIG